MGKVIVSASVSLDGFSAGPKVCVDRPMGAGGERLHEWLFDEVEGPEADVAERAPGMVGSVVMGRRTFDVGLAPWGGVPFPVPCFVLTHEARATMVTTGGTFTFVTDGLVGALRRARAAAGDRDVLVMGANVAQQFLDAELVDELRLQLVPVLLGTGTRLFDHLGSDHIELERTASIESPSVTHLWFRVVRERAPAERPDAIAAAVR